MALPSYSDLYEWFYVHGLMPTPVPDKRPTRKGLGRYARDTVMLNSSLLIPRWQRRWIGCTSAYDIMLNHFDIRLPSQTFWYDRLLVDEDIQHEKDEGIRPDTSEGRTTRSQALRWARSR